MAIIIRKNTNLNTVYNEQINRLVELRFETLEDAQREIEKELPWEKVNCDTLSTDRGTALWYYHANMDECEREDDTEGDATLFVVEDENSDIGYPSFP